MMCPKKPNGPATGKSFLEWAPLFLLFGCLFFFSLPKASARIKEVKVDRLISVTRLEALLRKGVLDGVMICGPDLIQIIQSNPNLNVEIRNSQILGGLDFTRLKALEIEKILERRNWAKKRKETWLKDKKSKGVSAAIVVENSITISNTTIFSYENSPKSEENQACQSFSLPRFNSVAVYAEGLWFADDLILRQVLFSGKASFAKTIFEGLADFNSAIFEGLADFNRASFEKLVDFNSSNFKEEASFGDAFFGGRATFSGAVLEKEAYFNESIFSGNAMFSDSAFVNGKALFGEVIFAGEVRYENVWISKGANFSNSIFKKNMTFRKSVFEEKADFSKSIFLGDSNFQKVAFDHEIDFSNAAFDQGGRTSFEGAALATLGGAALFDHANFSGEVDFSHARFSESSCLTIGPSDGLASFVDASFHEVARFDDALFCSMEVIDSRFKKLASFFTTGFYDEAKFQATLFDGPLYFQEASFFNVLRLEQDLFKGFINFHNAHISTLFFGHEEISGMVHQRLDFRDAKICEGYFRNLIFLKDVDLSYTSMGFNERGKAEGMLSCNPRNAPLSFYALSFEEGVSFVESRFRGQTLFDKVKFKKDVSFARTQFYKKSASDKNNGKEDALFLLSNVSFGALSLTWDQLPALEFWFKPKDDVNKKTLPQETQEGVNTRPGRYFGDHIEAIPDALLKLEVQFRKNNQLSDANEAFYAMKEEERKNSLDFWEKGLHFLWWLSFGYGRSLKMMLISSVLIHIPFTLFYFFLGKLSRRPLEKLKEESIFKLKLAVLPGEYLREDGPRRDEVCRYKLVNAFLLSVLLLLKLGYRNISISEKPKWKRSKIGNMIKWCVRFECVFGYIWLIAALYTLRNTVPFLKTLISL